MPKGPFEENKLHFPKVILAFWCLLEVKKGVITNMFTVFFENSNNVTQTLVYT